MVSRKTSQRTLAFAASIKSIQAQHLRNSARPFKRQLQPRIVATIVLHQTLCDIRHAVVSHIAQTGLKMNLSVT